MTTTLQVLLLFSYCGAVFGYNNTFDNEILPESEQQVRNRALGDDPYGNQTLKEIFESAVDAYLEEDWNHCVDRFNRALHGYKTYKRMVISCRQKCRARAAGETPIYGENIEDLHFYEKKVAETLCLLMCNQDYREVAGSNALRRLPFEVEQKFIDHEPYEYLHICYFKMNRYQDAANSVFTFLVMHAEHQPSIESLKYYLSLPDVQEAKIVNLEAMPYVSMYFKGVEAYDDQDYSKAAGAFESSLRSYLESEEQCRIYCEGPFDQGWHPEFTSSIANHFAFCLKCKRACSHMMRRVNGEYRDDMLKSHYDYLQFSYYKLGKLKAACAAVESYLLFAPADETMLHNKEYYSKQPSVEKTDFTPREEAVFYIKRDLYEKKLMRFIMLEFKAIEKRLETTKKNEPHQSEKKKEDKEELDKVTND